jgi:chromosome partitioning protein
MADIISVVNQKGGVGKTATSRYIADICVAMKKKVLLIDFDPQASLTKSFGLDPQFFEGINSGNIVNIFKKEIVEVVNVAREGSDETLHLIPSNRELGMVSTNIPGKDLILRQFIRKNKLDSVYDVIIIDNNPKFDTMTINTMLVANIIVVPVVTSKDEQEGLEGFFRNAEDTLSIFDHEIKKIVVIPSRYNKKTKVHKEYLKIIKEDTIPMIEEQYPYIANSKIFISNAIPDLVAFPDASSYNMSVYNYLKDYGSQTNMEKNKRKQLLALLEKIVKKTLK